MSVARSLFSWVVPVLILAAAIGGFLAMGSQPPPQRKVSAAVLATPVRTAFVEKGDGHIEIDADGVVVPIREVTLAAEVPGRIMKKSANCRAGKFVKAGTVLFEIDNRDYQLDVARLEGERRQSILNIEEIDEEIEQNKESLGHAQQQLELVHKDVKRFENLKVDRIVTEADLDRSLREELTVANSLTMLQGQQRVLTKRRSRLLEAEMLAGTMLERVKLDLERTRVLSPSDGMIVADLVEQDSFVSKGTPLVTLEDTSAAEVKTSLRMDEIARIWGGRSNDETKKIDGNVYDIPETPVSVAFTIGNRTYQWDGILTRQEGRGLDEKTRTLPCRVLVEDPTNVKAIDAYGAPLATLPLGAPRSLFRGMFVEVKVHVDSTLDLVSIPQEAMHPSGDVWVLREGVLMIFHPHVVHVLRGLVSFEADESGLVPGDRVVISQISNPRQGMALSDASSLKAIP